MEYLELARQLAEESIVLLKNEDGLLPFSGTQRLALFGRAQIETILSGNGSGSSHIRDGKSILDACEEKGLALAPELKAYYREAAKAASTGAADAFDWSKAREYVNSGLMYEIFGKYRAPAAEFPVPSEQMAEASAFTDTAVFVLGRNAGGEECDRHYEGDYTLTPQETELLDAVCRSFPKVVLVLNVNGVVDLSWAEDYPSVKSVLFLGVPGQEGGAALVNVLCGAVNPSGKLAVTIAKRYEDYPSSGHFSWDKDDEEKLLTYESYGLSAAENGSVGFAKSPVTVYHEDIFLGYRYFDTFGKKPLYPFGFGLSYTDFALSFSGAEKVPGGMSVSVAVTNTGAVPGKETAQLYLSAAAREKNRAYQELKAFDKTRLLTPGEQQTLRLFLPWRELARYDEKSAAYRIEQGRYLLRVGNSSANTCPALSIRVDGDVLAEQCQNRLGIQICNRGIIEFLENEKDAEFSPCACEVVLTEEDIIPVRAPRSTGEGELREKVRGLSDELLAALCVGYGPGTPFSAFGDGNDPETICDENGRPITTNDHPTGFNGYISPAVEEEGIHSIFYKDGPAGIGGIAWPTEMLLACCFDRRLWYAFGDAVGAECEKQRVDVWLAPAVNLHRHPLGGRNFEYVSEDPILTGVCACEIARGVQENHPVLVCTKHFALNEQETFRRGSTRKNYDAADSIVTERTARELYLKPFEMLIRSGGISCLMTSFNKINGCFAAGNKDLCTHILREEWGFQGLVVTDWGDMDVVVDGADAVAAGNDVIMPGGPPVIVQILNGLKQGRVDRPAMEKAVRHLLSLRFDVAEINTI